MEKPFGGGTPPWDTGAAPAAGHVREAQRLKPLSSPTGHLLMARCEADDFIGQQSQNMRLHLHCAMGLSDLALPANSLVIAQALPHCTPRRLSLPSKV